MYLSRRQLCWRHWSLLVSKISLIYSSKATFGGGALDCSAGIIDLFSSCDILTRLIINNHLVVSLLTAKMLALQRVEEDFSREWVAWCNRECNVQDTLWLDSIRASQVLVELGQRLWLSQHDHITLWEEVDADGMGWCSDNNMMCISMIIHGAMYCADVGRAHIGIEDKHFKALHTFLLLYLRRNPGSLLI